MSENELNEMLLQQMYVATYLYKAGQSLGLEDAESMTLVSIILPMLLSSGNTPA